jgi:hypothetical protein
MHASAGGMSGDLVMNYVSVRGQGGHWHRPVLTRFNCRDVKVIWGLYYIPMP